MGWKQQPREGSTVDKIKMFWKENVDTKVVVSTVIGGVVLGGMIYFATRSGLKPLQKAAKVAAGGK